MQVRAELMIPAAAAVAALHRQEDPDAAAQQAEAAALQEAVPEKLDEFGRDENAVRRDRARTRSAARAAALAELQKRFESSPAAALCDSQALAAAACGSGEGEAGAHVADAERRAYYGKRLGELQVRTSIMFSPRQTVSLHCLLLFRQGSHCLRLDSFAVLDIRYLTIELVSSGGRWTRAG